MPSATLRSRDRDVLNEHIVDILGGRTTLSELKAGGEMPAGLFEYARANPNFQRRIEALDKELGGKGTGGSRYSWSQGKIVPAAMASQTPSAPAGAASPLAPVVPHLQGSSAPTGVVPSAPVPAFAPKSGKPLLERLVPEVASSTLYQRPEATKAAGIPGMDQEFMDAAAGKITVDQIKNPFLKQTLIDISQRDPVRWRRIQQEASVPAMAARQAAVAAAVQRPSPALGGASVSQALSGADAVQPASDERRAANAGVMAARKMDARDLAEARRQIAMSDALKSGRLSPDRAEMVRKKLADSRRVRTTDEGGALQGPLRRRYEASFPDPRTRGQQSAQANPAALLQQAPAIGGGAPTTDPYAPQQQAMAQQVDAAKVTLDQWAASVSPEQMDEIRSAMIGTNTASGRAMGEIMQARAQMYSQRNLTADDLARLEDDLNRREMAVTYGFARSGMMSAVRRKNELKQQAVDAAHAEKLDIEKQRSKDKSAQAEKSAQEKKRETILKLAEEMVKGRRSMALDPTKFDDQMEFDKALATARRIYAAANPEPGGATSTAGTDESPSADPQSRSGGWKMPVKQGADKNWYPQPTTQAELDSIPIGTKYMRDDGRVFTKK